MDQDVIAYNSLVSGSAPIKKKRTGVEDVKIFNATRKTKITFVLVGMWTIDMPPYNLARLTAVTRAAGYETELLDFNRDSYEKMKIKNPKVSDTYNPSLSWNWHEERHYYKNIFPDLKECLDEYVEQLCNKESNIIGFSLYWTNRHATNYIASRVKERNPNKMIIYGGPTCADKKPYEFVCPDYVDYYFVGESEQNILDFLQAYEDNTLPLLPTNKRIRDKKIGGLYSDIRINLDTLPFPDYSGIDVEKYGNCVTAEFSRGCVARCNYCSEVWYWKFRDRSAKNMVDELQYQQEKHNTQFVYFADSLMNGNLKEFRNFCQEIVDRNFTIKWWGYARADGRMDLEFFKLIAKAGANGFNFGFESGSDKVLKAINKGNTVADINQNLIDCGKAGVNVSALMIFGAPGEDIEAFAHTLNLIWNHRERIQFISIGTGLGDNPGTAYDDREKFNISDRECAWLGRWWSLDLKNTGAHRFVRAKLFNILVDIANKNSKEPMHNQGYPFDKSDHYTVSFDNDINNEIENEFDFAYEPIKSDLSVFANSLMNEPFALLRTLWKAKGAYSIEIKFNPEIDDRDFDSVKPYNWLTYNANIKFKIDNNGNYDVICEHDFVDHQKNRHVGGRKENPVEQIDESFKYTYKGSGKWL